MLNKYIVFILLPIFINSEKIGDIDDSDSISSDIYEKRVSARFHFNHPPSIESYNPIPVDVVYDEDRAPEGRTLNEEINSNPITKEDINPELKVNNNKPKGRGLNYDQIPVAVIYDDEADNPQNYPNNKHPTAYNNKFSSNEKYSDDSSRQSKSLKTTRTRDPVVPIVQSENYVYSDRGDFHYSYESGDGTRAFSRGELKDVDNYSNSEAVVGGFSYTGKDGNDYSLTYTAGVDGYRPVGAHLPTPPPIPPAIARALKYLATATTPESATEPAKK